LTSSRPLREQQRWDEHAAFMDGLADDGFVLWAGGLLRVATVEPWEILLPSDAARRV
jgi:hypothetical protein